MIVLCGITEILGTVLSLEETVMQLDQMAAGSKCNYMCYLTLKIYSRKHRPSATVEERFHARTCKQARKRRKRRNLQGTMARIFKAAAGQVVLKLLFCVVCGFSVSQLRTGILC